MLKLRILPASTRLAPRRGAAALLALGVGIAVWARSDSGAGAPLPSGAGAPLPSAAQESPTATAAVLAGQLGCGACHGAPFPPLSRAAPPLADAGRKYRSGYTTDFLRAPQPVRPGYAPARMPDFALSADEAAALSAHLETLRGTAALPTPPRARVPAAPGGAAERLIDELGCTGCHTLRGTGAGTAVELGTVGRRLTRDWVRALLLDPEAVEPGTAMPALFFRRAANGAYEPLAPDAGARLEAVVELLFPDDDDRAAAPPAVTAAGAQLFAALQCAACHVDVAAAAPPDAPDLRYTVALTRRDWLASFLRRPAPIRPFGHTPGSGARMPDFQLRAAQVDSLHALLTRNAVAAPAAAVPAPLPAYARVTAERLLREKLPCLGCHALDGAGGRIGPELGAVAARRTPAGIAAIIDAPATHAPGTVMPPTPLSAYDRRRVIGYLVARTATPAAPVQLSALDHPPLDLTSSSASARAGAAGDYSRHCAACHGASGGGDGFNARFLDPAPVAHADAAIMSARPDDALFDAIAAGGHIMGRSPAMPAYGAAFAAPRTRALVRYLRTLCRCTGPAWATSTGAGS